MNLRDLQYLIALAEHRHFGKAAQACFVSQPALSMQIKKLEDHLETQLIERTNKSVMLTQNGIALAERARMILNQVQELKNFAKAAKDPYHGELKVGIIPTLAPYLLPHIMPCLVSTFPKLSLLLFEAQTAELLKQLKEGKLDAAILALPITEPGIQTGSLFHEEFLLGVPKGHPLAKRKIIRQSELADNELLLLEDGHCLRDQALDVCRNAQAKESKSFRATSLETLRHMVASGIGSTLLPKLAHKKGDGIAYLAFNHPKPSRHVGLVWRYSSAKEKLFHALINTIQKCIK